MKSSQHEIIQTLAERIREIEARREGPRTKDQQKTKEEAAFFSSLVLGPSSLIEMVSLREGDGAGTLALWLARQACADGKAIVVADSEGTFYPPGAAALGDDWDSCIVVRPQTLREAHLAAEYSLRCPAVGAVVARCGNLSVPVARRLQAAAEVGGGVGMILRSAAALGTPAFATLRLLIRPVPPLNSPIAKGTIEGERRQLQVDVVYYRGNAAGQSFVLEVDHETGHVHLLAGVAAAKARSRAAGASG